MKSKKYLKEVYTEKQRRWACWQMNAPASEREISKKEATEMCKDVKHSKNKDKKESINPKMKKGDLVEYIKNSKKINENKNPYSTLPEMDRSDKAIVVRWLEKLRESGVINMFGCAPMLCWTREDLHRWLYGQGKDPESIESEIEDLEYYDEDDEDYQEYGSKESLEEKLEVINYLLENKDSVRDALIRTSLNRIERTTKNHELSNVQRVFERMATEAWKMWTTLMYN
jgi:hypothetical protein